MRLSFLPLVAAVTLALGACSGERTDTREVAQPSPPIFFEQVAVLMEDGQPKEQQAYHHDLQQCAKEGTPTRPLSADDEARLGRRLTQTWQTPGQFAQRSQEWHQSVVGLCQFGLFKQDRIVLRTSDNRAYNLDTVSGMGSASKVAPLPRMVKQTTDDLTLSKTATEAGWADPVKQAPLMGHTCLLWQNPTGQQACVWDEGQAYGYSATAQSVIGSDGTPRPQGALLLWGKPAQGNGWEVRMTRLIVGEPIPPSVFNLPANAKVERPA